MPIVQFSISAGDTGTVHGRLAGEHYAKRYAVPGAMHSGFAQFAAFDQDAIHNRAMLATARKLSIPVLAIGRVSSIQQAVIPPLNFLLFGD